MNKMFEMKNERDDGVGILFDSKETHICRCTSSCTNGCIDERTSPCPHHHDHRLPCCTLLLQTITQCMIHSLYAINTDIHIPASTR